MLKKLGLTLLLGFFSIAPSFGQDKLLNPNHPDQYVVVKGDTLWDISGRFLRAPWLWPEVWQVNPQIKNPHLIYPGDLISLIYVNGQPRLVLSRGGYSRGDDIKMEPGVRITSNAEAIPTIPIEKIGPFLNRAGVLTQKEFDESAYVLATSDEQILVSNGDKIYARGLKDKNVERYNVVRKGVEYKNPPDGVGVGSGKAGESLGFESVESADAQITDFAEVSSAMITRSVKEAAAGDRLIPAPADKPLSTFFPRAPKEDITGAIVGTVDDSLEIGQYSVVAINLGAQDKMEVGHVMGLYHKGRVVEDSFMPSKMGSLDIFRQKDTAAHKQAEPGKPTVKKPEKMVRLPDERIGEVLIFRVFNRVSYALIVNTTDAVNVFDLVKTPK